MSKILNNPLLLVIFLLAGCAAVPVDYRWDKARNVKVKKADPPSYCKEVMPIEVTHGNGCGGFGARGDYKNAYIMLKNEAYSNGANYVRIDEQVAPIKMATNGGCASNEYTIRGVAYFCRKKK